MTTTTTERRVRATAAAALSALLLATGCAGGGASDTPDGTLNVGQISDSVAFFPLYVAEERGYFADEGVELGERPRMGTGAKLAAALQSGSIDLGAGVLTDALNLYGNDDSAELAASLIEKYYVDIVVGADFDGPGADAPLEERIAALEGKKIGITGPGSGTEALVGYTFQQNGMDPATDAELVNLGADPPAALGALESGQVDALSFFQPVPQQAEATGVGTTYISPSRGDIPGFEDTAHGVVFTTADVREDKPDEVAAFQRAIERANTDIREGTEVEELLASYMEGIDVQARADLLPIMQEETAADVGFSEDSVETALEFHSQTGLVEDPPGYTDIVPEDLRTQ
ncbi:ABC transporter substrate-binding protein [Streptomonospora salina]|uniref:ABC-type nitrate/sulfonate/bicarbonate transport system substrate-binding protein n=1 Tax=Streptomonospora salina TaxID=104205 RepID=A0A841EHE4_9ACTN|nr:ABC transporter substrate-binding protein [Streptomonospora salina]MBB5999800.1 ABC-type nitrate/sulfonate/bicarbonate transport system substrate-binding protein [Streptomonospora salina]